MLAYTIKRFFEMIVVFFLFLVISYLLFNAIPGNAFSSLLLNPLLPPEAYQKTIEAFGLDKPLLERLQLYIVNFFKGDFGYSYTYYPRTPIDLIAERLPRTLMLFSIVNIVAFYTGFLVGKILAWRRGSKSETWITIGSVFSYTVFYPWFALMMLWFFGYQLDWFPLGKFLVPEKWYDAPFSSDEIFYTLILFTTILSFLLFLVFIFTRTIESIQNRRNARLFGLVVLLFISAIYWSNGEAALKRFYAADIAYHMILPTFTVTLVAFAGTALLTRTTMMEVLKDDYILTARAKGLSEKVVHLKHCLRNALIPIVTGLADFLTVFFAGSLLLELIFNLDGMGLLGYKAVLERDYNVVMGLIFVQSVLMLVGRLISDLIYVVVDPRIDFS